MRLDSLFATPIQTRPRGSAARVFRDGELSIAVAARDFRYVLLNPESLRVPCDRLVLRVVSKLFTVTYTCDILTSWTNNDRC